MTAVEIKKEINKVLDQVPETLLPEILNLVKGVQSDESSVSELASNFRKILSEDSELLRRLAQ